MGIAGRRSRHSSAVTSWGLRNLGWYCGILAICDIARDDIGLFYSVQIWLGWDSGLVLGDPKLFCSIYSYRPMDTTVWRGYTIVVYVFWFVRIHAGSSRGFNDVYGHRH